MSTGDPPPTPVRPPRAHLPTERMVISPGRPALAPGLVALVALAGDGSTWGHFFWLQRVQGGSEGGSDLGAGPCTVCRCCWCRHAGGN